MFIRIVWQRKKKFRHRRGRGVSRRRVIAEGGYLYAGTAPEPHMSILGIENVFGGQHHVAIGLQTRGPGALNPTSH